MANERDFVIKCQLTPEETTEAMSFTVWPMCSCGPTKREHAHQDSNLGPTD